MISEKILHDEGCVHNVEDLQSEDLSSSSINITKSIEGRVHTMSFLCRLIPIFSFLFNLVSFLRLKYFQQKNKDKRDLFD